MGDDEGHMHTFPLGVFPILKKVNSTFDFTQT